MFRSCSISLREGTSSGHVPTPSGSWVPGASAPDMLSSRARRRSRRPEAALGAASPAQSRGTLRDGLGQVSGSPAVPAAPGLAARLCTATTGTAASNRCRYQTGHSWIFTGSSLLLWPLLQGRTVLPHGSLGAGDVSRKWHSPLPAGHPPTLAVTVPSRVFDTAVALSEICAFITSN